MGGGSYEREVVSTTGNSSSAAAVALKQHSFHEDLKVLNKVVTCDEGTPIVLCLDISGSMNEWPRIVYDKLPMFFGQLKMQNYVQDPKLSFASFSGGYPLQVTKFCEGLDCDTELKKMYMACGGGDGEPYADAAYFFASDKHVKFGAGLASKPYFFFTGDEVMGSFAQQLERNVKQTMDPTADCRWDDLQGFWNRLKEKYNVFHVAKPGAHGVREEWSRILGSDRVLMLQTPKAVVDCILGAIAITSGARTIEEYGEDLKERGQDEERQKEVLLALSVLPAAREDTANQKAADVTHLTDGAGSSPPADLAVKLTNVFCCLDAEKTGKVSRQDLKLLLSLLDKSFSSASMDQLLTAATEHEDGEVDYAQFIDYIFH
jgi:hypothetical protein